MHIVPVPTLNCDTKWERAQKREKRKLFHCARSVSAKSGGFRPTFAFTSRGRTCIVLASLNQTGRSKWIYIYPFPAPTHTHSLSSSCSLSHVVKAQFYHGKALSLFPSLSLHLEAAAHGRTSQFFFHDIKRIKCIKTHYFHPGRVRPYSAGLKGFPLSCRSEKRERLLACVRPNSFKVLLHAKQEQQQTQGRRDSRENGESEKIKERESEIFSMCLRERDREIAVIDF